MKLSELKQHLLSMDTLTFILPNGKSVPSHFHVTEVGQIEKSFIDCGGTVRKEKTIVLQLWKSIDFHHRLKASKLLSIIEMSEQKLHLSDEEIEVEYQGETIEKFGLAYSKGNFLLTQTKTACLAEDSCGITLPKISVSLSGLGSNEKANTCTPGLGCC
jgi:hypothetical protein